VAMSEWKKAKAAVNAQTPEGIVYYLHFQRWRMLQTWRSHFALSIDGNGDGAGTDADNDARKKALADAEAVLGGVSLRDAANQSRDAIPEGMVLHRQIKALGG
jgi:hypothetical protein